jgi:hypothetical protein
MMFWRERKFRDTQYTYLFSFTVASAGHNKVENRFRLGLICARTPWEQPQFVYPLNAVLLCSGASVNFT